MLCIYIYRYHIHCIQLQPLWTMFFLRTSSRASDQEPLVWLCRSSSANSRVCACSKAAVDRARNMARSSWAGTAGMGNKKLGQ